MKINDEILKLLRRATTALEILTNTKDFQITIGNDSVGKIQNSYNSNIIFNNNI